MHIVSLSLYMQGGIGRILIEENRGLSAYSPVKPYSSGFLNDLPDFCVYDGDSMYTDRENLNRLMSFFYSSADLFRVQSHIPSDLLELLDSRPEGVVDMRKIAALKSYRMLYPYQQEVFHDVVLHQGRRGIFNDMGTGKTAISIALLEYYRSADQQLICCPASLCSNWKRELEKYSDLESHILKTSRDTFAPGKVNILSYGLIRLFPAEFWKSMNLNMIVCDESHHLKNRLTIVSKHVTKICLQVPRILLLSGTPASRPVEFYTQLKILAPALFRHFSRFTYSSESKTDSAPFFFGDRYCNPVQKYIGYRKTVWDFRGCTRPRELNALLSLMAVRVRKEDVIHLPPKERFQIPVQKSTRESRLRWRHTLHQLQETRVQQGEQAANREITRLSAANTIYKLNFIAEEFSAQIYPLFSDSIGKILIFAHHRSVIDKITELLLASEYKDSFVTITGETKLSERERAVQRFQGQEPDSPRIAVLSILAAGTGLNFYRASTVIFLELLWSNKDMIQAEDRAHRIGQENPVHVYYFIQPDSVDQLIFDTMVKKQINTHLILDNLQVDFRIDECVPP